MAWTTITKPTQGTATKKSLIDAIIDNLTYLFSAQSTSALVANGSFEDDGDADGTPDGWTKTLYTGGSFTLDTSDQQHGDTSAKFTSPGGASNGGGYLVTDDFFQVSPNRRVEVLWELKSSAAGVNNRVEIYWYKSDQTASTTASTTLYSSSANPTSWTAMGNSAAPPSDARFAKLRVTGCHTSSTTAGSTWFDNVQVRIRETPVPTTEVITATGTWVCPNGVSRVEVECWGGGGEASGYSGVNASTGGGGEYTTGCFNVSAGTSYTVTIGAGGTGTAPGSSASGNAGGNTSFDSFLSANGGGAGTSGVAGAGGTGGSGASFAITGQSGQAGSNAIFGGSSPRGGFGGWGTNGTGTVPGGGGGVDGGDGAAGRIVLRY